MENDTDILLSVSGNWWCKLNAITAKIEFALKNQIDLPMPGYCAGVAVLFCAAVLW
jgi:hypothetical protein